MPKRLLVVDDDPAVRDLVKKYFSAAGWEVEVAKTGTEGLALAGGKVYEVILLDVKLPDGKGTDFCRRLRLDPKMARVPVFLMSGALTGTGDKIEGMDLGAVDYVVKPLALEALLARINAMARLSAASGQKRTG